MLIHTGAEPPEIYRLRLEKFHCLYGPFQMFFVRHFSNFDSDLQGGWDKETTPSSGATSSGQIFKPWWFGIQVLGE